MNIITLIMAVFSVLGAIDRILGNKLGIGKEFEKGFMLLGTMALTMLGMIVISPLIAKCLMPILKFLPVEPSVIPAIFFANDMGAAQLSRDMATNPLLGSFNGLVVASMMGCTLSFTLPLAFEMVHKEKQNDMLLGLLCGIATIPVGCIISGILAKLSPVILIKNMIPLILFSALVAFGLWFFPKICTKIFYGLAYLIKILITLGLILGIIEFLLGYKLIESCATLNEGAKIIFNSGVVMSGAFPLISIISRILSRPLKKLGHKLQINETSAMGLVATLATNVTTLDMINKMDRKGTIINSAFLVSASFVFAGHLAFTLAFSPDYIAYVITGKLISGISAGIVALLLYRHLTKEELQK